MTQFQNLLLRLLVATLFFLPFTSAAQFLPDEDHNPLTGIFGFPGSTEGANVLRRGQHDWETSLVTASHNIEEIAGNETLAIDGETTRFTFGYRFGWSDDLDIRIQVPYQWHQSGSLDSVIDGWHDFFGLPDGARDTRQRDQLNFLYTDSSNTLVNFSENSNGIGDIRVSAGWRLKNSDKRQSALRFSIKLPTGDDEIFMGSGGIDLSIGVAQDIASLWGNPRINGMYRANLTYLGKPTFLSDRHKDFVGQLGFGFSYQVHQKVDLIMQSRVRSAVYDSDTDNLGAASLSLTFGADLRLSDRSRLSLSVGEDLIPGTAPDVSFQVAFRYRGQQ